MISIMKRMVKRFFAWAHAYERHLSALAMIAGFVADNLVFTRIDLLQTQLLLAGYAIACAIAIPALHWIESRATKRGTPLPRSRLVLAVVTQFALGGFWSAFVIFYGRSAVLGVSWPFLILVFLIFFASEYFHQYHQRLVFTTVLFFFALYNYAIFEVPIYVGTIGTLTFLLSGLVAIAVFIAFTSVLRLVAHTRFKGGVWRIRLGALIVLVLMNLFYFTSVLPPMPLSATAAGVYHSVWRVPGAYMAAAELENSWLVRYLGFSPTLHVTEGEQISAYSSVFAPTTLTATVAHRWSWYDSANKRWVERATISYPIIGGRDNGYRGYSTVPITSAGSWRVDVVAADGRVIARMPFTAEFVPRDPTLTTVTLD